MTHPFPTPRSSDLLLGEALAELEGGAGGTITATGMAAITLVLHALLEPGDRLVVPHDGYGGSWRLFKALAAKGAFELVLADLTDPRALAARSEEHTSELQSLMRISSAVFCLKKKTNETTSVK